MFVPLARRVPRSSARGRRHALAVSLSSALTLLATLVGGCQSQMAAPGLWVLCSNDDVICESWVRNFQAETGISTRYQRLPTAEALVQLQAHQHRPQFDVWVGGSAENYLIAAEAHLLRPSSPAAASDLPAQFRDPEGYWYGVYGSLLGFCTNLQVAQRLGIEPPDSWAALSDPTLRNWVGASSPLSSGTAFTTLWLQVELFGPTAADHLDSLYGQVERLTHSGTSPAAQAARGEVAVAVSFVPYCEYENQRHRDPLIITYPQEGTSYEIGAAGVLAQAVHPEAAAEFLNWLISEPGQRTIVDSPIAQMPVSRRLEGNLNQVLTDTDLKVVDLDLDRAARDRSKWLSWFARRS